MNHLNDYAKTELSKLAKLWLDASVDPDSATALGEIEIELEAMLAATGVMSEDDAIESIEPLQVGPDRAIRVELEDEVVHILAE